MERSTAKMNTILEQMTNQISKTLMKKLLYIIAFILPILCIGQTTTQNYVKTTSYLQAIDENQENSVNSSQKIEGITYYDGLGRVKQAIAVRAGGQNQNIVTYVEYDALGRTPKEYLPYATDTEVTNPLDFTSPSTLKTAIEQFYHTPKYEDTQNPYSEMVYENSPLNRIYEQAAPGNSWALSQGHTTKLDYLTNSVSEVRYFKVNFIGGNPQNPELLLNGYYGASQLYKNVIKDENWTPASVNNHTTEEFTNKLGQVVLKRTYNDNQTHDTYYVYDDYGNLSFVLSPLASENIVIGDELRSDAETVLDDLCYLYKYDYRNRLIEKKVPGKGWEYIVYNKLNQPILTQDANQRAKSPKEWVFTKYDAFGRVAYTGIKKSNISRESFQTIADDSQYQYEQMTSNAIAIADTQVYYSNLAIPTVFDANEDQILTINYYDQYIDLDGYTLPSLIYGQNRTIDTKGLPTVSKVRVLTDDTNDWITTVTGYDDKARPIFTRSVNTYLATEDISQSLLDFTGQVIENRISHQKAGHQEVITKDFFSYDHQNRLITHLQQIDNEPVQLIVSNTYDELGQLESKRVGGQLFESGYTDITEGRIDISEDGIITKIDGGNSYNAGLATVGKIEGDGGISFINLVANKGYIIGLNDNSQYTNSTGEIDYAFFFHWNNPGRYKVRIREDNVSTYITGYINYDANDHFAIERDGDVLSFIHNGAVVATHTMTQDFPSLVGDLSIRDEGTQIGNLNLYTTTIDKSLQKVDYQYNVRGWLTDINNVNTNTADRDLFNFQINYDGDLTGNTQATPLYNGNISQTIWRTPNTDTQKRAYEYAYDNLNRITDAFSLKGSNLLVPDTYSLNDVGYDKNGNITSLKRKGYVANTGGLNTMDDLSYSYNGNQLLAVQENELLSPIKNEGFYDANTVGDDYQYDVNGNMTSDKNKGIGGISYNYLNLPTHIRINTTDANGDTQKGTITYIYDATGVKLAKVVQNEIQESTISTLYATGYIYENNNGYELLKIFPHPEGYVEPVYGTTKSIKKFNKETQTSSFSNYQYAFNYTDHLGNVRLSYADSDGDGSIKPSTEIISEKNYYPFGVRQKGYNSIVTSNSNSIAEKIKTFQGQERNEDLGLFIYEWKYRISDPAIGRFWQVDPLAEKYEWMTVYQFSSNQPIHAPELEGLESAFDLNSRDPNLQNLTKEEKQAFNEAQNDALVFGVEQIIDEIPVLGEIKDLIKGESIGTTLLGLIPFAKKGQTIIEGVSDVNKQINKLEKRIERLNKVDRSGKNFTKAGKEVVKEQNKLKNGGKIICEGCKVETVPSKKSVSGVTPPRNEAQVDHINPKSNGGRGNPDNGQILCRGCNREKSNKLPDNIPDNNNLPNG